MEWPRRVAVYFGLADDDGPAGQSEPAKPSLPRLIAGTLGAGLVVGLLRLALEGEPVTLRALAEGLAFAALVIALTSLVVARRTSSSAAGPSSPRRAGRPGSGRSS